MTEQKLKKLVLDSIPTETQRRKQERLKLVQIVKKKVINNG